MTLIMAIYWLLNFMFTFLLLFRLDKVHNKRASKDPKLAKKIKRIVGEPKAVDPPANTPLWAVSHEWLERIRNEQADG